jgi:hypothetical protein
MTDFTDCTCKGIQTEVTCPVHGDQGTAEFARRDPPTAELDTEEFVPHRDLHAPPLPETHELDRVDLTETVIDPDMPFARAFALGLPQPDTAEDIVDAELVEELAPGDLAAGDRQAAEAFRRHLASGSVHEACDRLLAYLTASEPVRRANPDGEVTPFFGLGEPPSLEVAAVSVDGWVRALHATMFQRRLP